MAYTETEIVNLAIAIMGSAGQINKDMIDDLNGDATDDAADPALAKLQTLYPMARDYAEIKLAPREVVRYVQPGTALTSATANKNPGWQYIYAQPVGSLAILDVVYQSYHDSATGRDVSVPHAVIGSQVACDCENTDIFVKYVHPVTSAAEFGTGLVMVIAHRLAYTAARSVGGLDKEARAQLLMEFKDALNEAKSLEGANTFVPPATLTPQNAHYSKSVSTRAVRDSSGNIVFLGA